MSDHRCPISSQVRYPLRAGTVSSFGEADRMRRPKGGLLDAVAGSGTMEREEEGYMHPDSRNG